MFAVGQYTRDSLAQLLAASMTTIEASKRKHQREATGAIAGPTPPERREHHNPAVAPKKIAWRPRSQLFNQLVRRRTKTDPTSQKRVFAQELDSFIAVAAPRAGF